jgi:protein phosphatase
MPRVAVVSDRGLSEKRPLNEDSYLSDPERRIFAVADGVGGAQAGEVASQTAMEVLDEAFRHQVDGADVEDLMEIAIQRANHSIYKMAQEHQKFSAMATTVVALHLDGNTATIGHVGDSRIYRLKPDGQLLRETNDHSVVEEEVRAGRMTPEQAAHHPSRNVISRALGAESTVEVDMKTIEIEEGTAFLLCSDGITRHIPDNELRELLSGSNNLEEVCAEMKRRCYERGAEDNLTAVIVRIGEGTGGTGGQGYDDEATIVSERGALAAAISGADHTTQGFAPVPAASAAPMPQANGDLQPASPVVFAPQPPMTQVDLPAASAAPVPSAAPLPEPRRRGASRAASLLRTLGLLLLLAAVGAAAFYAGGYFERRQTDIAQSNPNNAPAAAAPAPLDSVGEFEQRRLRVDRAPAQMANDLRTEATGKGLQNPLDSTDPGFLYLYGRALLLSGDYANAMTAFEHASTSIGDGSSPLQEKLKVESRLAIAATAHRLRGQLPDADQRAARALEELSNKANAAPPPQ